MTREEEIEIATASYINGRLKNNVPPEEIEEIRLAYQAGAIYADEHPINYDGKAMLHVLNKSAEQAKKQTIERACEWWKNEFTHPSMNPFEIEYYKDKINEFRKAMEE